MALTSYWSVGENQRASWSAVVQALKTRSCGTEKVRVIMSGGGGAEAAGAATADGVTDCD